MIERIERIRKEAKCAEGMKRMLLWPELGMEFTRLYSPQETLLAGFFEPVGKPGCAPAGRVGRHVYRVQIKKALLGGYCARAYCDGDEVFSLFASCRSLAEKMALGALRARVRRTCRRTVQAIKAWADVAQSKEPPEGESKE